jgi:hypothetical protein
MGKISVWVSPSGFLSYHVPVLKTPQRIRSVLRLFSPINSLPHSSAFPGRSAGCSGVETVIFKSLKQPRVAKYLASRPIDCDVFSFCLSVAICSSFWRSYIFLRAISDLRTRSKLSDGIGDAVMHAEERPIKANNKNFFMITLY